jgi:hypothetical protein
VKSVALPLFEQTTVALLGVANPPGGVVGETLSASVVIPGESSVTMAPLVSFLLLEGVTLELHVAARIGVLSTIFRFLKFKRENTLFGTLSFMKF